MREGGGGTHTKIITLERENQVNQVFPGSHLIVQVLADAEKAA